jgi:hypothetical protein
MKLEKMIFVAALTALSMNAAAGDGEQKYLLPWAPGAGKVCPSGHALTYTMQCDPGTRIPVDEIWGTRAPGASLCRIRLQGCHAIVGFNPNAEAGYEVRDAIPSEEMVVVTFGLERLLGEWR